MSVKPISTVRARLVALRPGQLLQCSALAILAACSFSAAAGEPPAGFEEDFDDQTKQWTEIAVQMPPAPQEKDLKAFYVGPTARQQFFVDVNSISVGSDGVVRYTLVGVSQSGAKNISYEGIRCETYQKKQYAFGRSDGTWARSRQDQWRPITEMMANRQDAALAKDYLCDMNAVAGSAATIAGRFKNSHPLPAAADFLPGRY